MKTSEILIEAKKRLNTADKWSGKTIFCLICHRPNTNKQKANGLVAPYPCRRRGSGFSVAKWLLKHGHATREQITTESMQTYRHRWVDSWIA